jgi:hypothetical protein
MMNKTITPVISVILLIMLTIAVSATAWYWVNGLQANLEASSSQGIESTTTMGNIQYSMVSLSCNSSANVTIQLRNNGLSDISTTEIFLIKLLDNAGVELESTIQSLPTALGTSGTSSIGVITFVAATEFPSITSGTRYQVKTDVNGIAQTLFCTASE